MDINSLENEKHINIPYQVDASTKKEAEEAIYLEKQNEKYDNGKLEKSIEKLNKFLEDDKVHAEYSTNKDFGDIMIKIVDDNTKEVIMELPPEKILDMIASMCKQFGLLDKKA